MVVGGRRKPTGKGYFIVDGDIRGMILMFDYPRLVALQMPRTRNARVV
jgi:hypothetical protein